MRVREWMRPAGLEETDHFPLVKSDAPIEDAAALLSEREVHGLRVVEGGRTIGVLSAHDLARALAYAGGAGVKGSRFVIRIPDEPGALRQFLSLLWIHGVNVRGILVGPPNRKGAQIVLRTSKPLSRKTVADLEACGYGLEP